jgi:hypothetical protein
MKRPYVRTFVEGIAVVLQERTCWLNFEDRTLSSYTFTSADISSGAIGEMTVSTLILAFGQEILRFIASRESSEEELAETTFVATEKMAGFDRTPVVGATVRFCAPSSSETVTPMIMMQVLHFCGRENVVHERPLNMRKI